MCTVRIPSTKEEFNELTDEIESREGYIRPQAFGVGFITYTRDNQPLDVYFPAPNCNGSFRTAAILRALRNTYESHCFQGGPSYFRDALAHFAPFRNESGHANIAALGLAANLETSRSVLHTADGRYKAACVVFINDLQEKPLNLQDAYLRLHLLSHRLVQPNTINLDGIFGLLPNVAWTNHGPFLASEINAVITRSRLTYHTPLTVYSVDKFPRMVDYVVPSGVRIADADRVRLGAYLGEGTTVMHEGFVNFNAGTLGTSMVEGRISAGVVVGNGTDLGGSASLMGTLSGGGKEKIHIGENCLIGANGGCGISLGDFCATEAGLYVTAGSKVLIERGEYFDEVRDVLNDTIDLTVGKEITARDLSCHIFKSTFRRHSGSGHIECLVGTPNKERLNEMLHKN